MDDLFELNNGSTSDHLGALFEKYWIPAMRGKCIAQYQNETHIQVTSQKRTKQKREEMSEWFKMII